MRELAQSSIKVDISAIINQIFSRMSINVEQIGKLIKAQRKLVGLKQEELSKLSGVANSTLRRLESGQSVGLDNFLSIVNTLVNQTLVKSTVQRVRPPKEKD